MNERALAKWVEARAPLWQETGSRLARVERGRSAPPADVLAIVRSYPEIARDLAIARRSLPAGQLTQQLEGLFGHVHRVIFRSPAAIGRDLAQLFLGGAARIAASLRWHILWVTVLFVASLAAGYWLIAAFPELASLLASEQMISGAERGELWTDDLLNVVPSSLLSIEIFTNNVMVSLFAICLGLLFGLGTLYIIGMNGLSIGGIFAFTAAYGLDGRLFEFVIAHGPVELSVICIAGAVGASLGEALARPGPRTRRQALRHATRRGMRLMVVCLAFMVGAGLIEGYVSPNPAFTLPVRALIGVSYWILFVVVLTGGLERIATTIRKRRPLSGGRGLVSDEPLSA